MYGQISNNGQGEYDIYDMLEEDDNNKYQKTKQIDHKYPPYYFSHKLFGDMMEYDSDSSDDDSNRHNKKKKKSKKYSDKKQLTAFLLTVFLGWLGAGQFYVGRWFYGFIKLYIGLIACFATPCMVASSFGTAVVNGDSIREQLRDNESEIRKNLASLACCCQIIWVLVLIDIGLFAANVIKDVHGLPLQPW